MPEPWDMLRPSLLTFDHEGDYISWTIGEEGPCYSPSFGSSLDKLGYSIIFDLPVNLVPLPRNTLYCFNF